MLHTIFLSAVLVIFLFVHFLLSDEIPAYYACVPGPDADLLKQLQLNSVRYMGLNLSVGKQLVIHVSNVCVSHWSI